MHNDNRNIKSALLAYLYASANQAVAGAVYSATLQGMEVDGFTLNPDVFLATVNQELADLGHMPYPHAPTQAMERAARAVMIRIRTGSEILRAARSLSKGSN